MLIDNSKLFIITTVACSDFILILIELVDGWIVPVLGILRPDKYAEFAPPSRLKVLLPLDLPVGVPGRFIKLHADPVPRGELGHHTHVLDLASARANNYFAAGAHCDLIGFGLLKIVWYLVSTLFHKVRVNLLHLCLELAEGVVTLIVLLLADLVLLNLADVFKLREQTRRGRINDMNSIAFLRAIMSECLLIICHGCEEIPSRVPQLKAHGF